MPIKRKKFSSPEKIESNLVLSKVHRIICNSKYRNFIDTILFEFWFLIYRFKIRYNCMLLMFKYVIFYEIIKFRSIFNFLIKNRNWK